MAYAGRMDPTLLLALAAIAAAVTAAAYPLAFPRAPKWTHQAVFFGGIVVVIVLIGLAFSPKTKPDEPIAKMKAAAPKTHPTPSEAVIRPTPSARPAALHLPRFFSVNLRYGAFGEGEKRDDLTTLYVKGENTGSEEVAWSVTGIDISFPGGKCITPGGQGEDTFPGKSNEASIAVANCTIPTPTPNQGVEGRFVVRLRYDTIPATGVRRSTVTIRCVVANAQSMSKMLAGCEVLSDRPA